MDYNIEAANWDNEKRINRAKVIANEITNAIPMKIHYRALDFGCGTGLVSFNLYSNFEHITLVDTSEGMIQKLNEKIQASKVENMTSFHLDINNNSILKDKFDVIYTSLVLHHIKDTKTTLKNLYELLNDEGSLCIVELDEDDGSFHRFEKDFDGHNGFNQHTLKKLLEDIGYKSVVTNTFFSDEKVVNETKMNYSLFLMVGKK